eukprot:CAMPEP_0113684360 /NCGR_PEP_ID=MMETSP0038_2-20120614/13951_1 /TAXON_ID=2898 /ORGANISM="Cryptomonas paramecium" /LENGTH=105 /DNA_ID=CAMNT_0000604083 /DNA_START=60 /DNA_END=374 /DNA_ORIENTATION=+ /assembly_acc=CAM_ASM_000170
MKRENSRPRSNIGRVRPTPGIEPRSHSLQSDGVTNYATAPPGLLLYILGGGSAQALASTSLQISKQAVSEDESIASSVSQFPRFSNSTTSELAACVCFMLYSDEK